jgi:hypothetical protein
VPHPEAQAVSRSAAQGEGCLARYQLSSNRTSRANCGGSRRPGWARSRGRTTRSVFLGLDAHRAGRPSRQQERAATGGYHTQIVEGAGPPNMAAGTAFVSYLLHCIEDVHIGAPNTIAFTAEDAQGLPRYVEAYSR